MRHEDLGPDATAVRAIGSGVSGSFVELDGGDAYSIAGYDRMSPFLMSLVSESDLWMFISSAGGLTAGRGRPERCLFPYETDDRLHLSANSSGPLTLIRIGVEDSRPELWEPFCGAGIEGVRRRLSKSTLGNFVEFEEVHERLGLTFRYRWSPSDRFGFVRAASIELEAGATPVTLDILDGLQNVMPAGVDLMMQQRASTLADAYKRSELDPGSLIGIYSLEASISDRPEPSESLRANVVWGVGFDPQAIMVSSGQVGAFREGRALVSEPRHTGGRGAYLLGGTFTLAPGERRSWDIVADVNLSQDSVVALRTFLRDEPEVRGALGRSVAEGAAELGRIVAGADAFQCTADRGACVNHLANAMFNVMRGGVFANGYEIETRDFRAFVDSRNRPLARRREVFLAGLPARLDQRQLLSMADETSDPDLIRLCHEYLPLTFSRRHGDPSRPWNAFDIRVRGCDGERLLNYEGNWRDIFQNWETLCESYPWFVENVIAKFVNASTVDGYNPYRIGRDGIDWEVADPADPWSNIGYWGDHQIVYLLRLLESSQHHRPSALRGLLHQRVFSYADVPYRIGSFEELVADPKATIGFDEAREREVRERVGAIGADGRLVQAAGAVLHVNLIEKLLVAALAKLSNLVPDGGIWMNTQRPEWNDANNALVGHGVSVVTLCYMRRYLTFCIELMQGEDDTHTVELSTEVALWFDRVLTAMTETLDLLERSEIGAEDRRSVLERLGRAYCAYRERVYGAGFSGTESRPVRAVTDLFRIARHHVDHAIRANRRSDGLFHSYNLLILDRDERSFGIDTLPEMLEGQVAALSSGLLSTDESIRLIDGLFASPLYRRDQRSFMLYPERQLPSFLERSIVGPESIGSSRLLSALVDSGDTSIVLRDDEGVFRFNGDFRSLHDLRAALARLEGNPRWEQLVLADSERVQHLYEDVFRHHSFTGRSGSMYKYEGIGCIYWHMVSKLLLAIQELFFGAIERGEGADSLSRLALSYYEVRAGLGFNKSPLEHGAFPTDPYSHTPRHAGAQQPGMTGQAKEGALLRFGELGIRVRGGKIGFVPRLLRASEFLAEPGRLETFAAEGARRPIGLSPESLGFTLCQTPVLYRLTDSEACVETTLAGGGLRHVGGNVLEESLSAEVFGRTGAVSRIEVCVPRATLFEHWTLA